MLDDLHVVLEEVVCVGVDVRQRYPERLLGVIGAADRGQGTGLELNQKGMGEPRPRADRPGASNTWLPAIEPSSTDLGTLPGEG
ncbi:hypothetical protein H8F24_02980 [Synechococcus sp. CBW1002]|nr:hypothetical protein H8F24_02980 [Synechococcus sp. CBW1002]